MSQQVKRLLDQAYETPTAVPWEDPSIPIELVELVNSERLPRGNALDIGCGNGHYTIFLTQQGFTATGIDLSGNAIVQAKRNAQQAGVTPTFLELDARDVATLQEECFDLVLAWGVDHFIPFRFRSKYVRDMASTMRPGGTCVVLTFNINSPEWGGAGESRRVGLTNVPLYYTSLEDIVRLYEPCFRVVSANIRETYFANSGNTHLENLLVLERR